MKILAVKLRAIGDTVIWTSALNALHSQYSGASIHTLTYAGNADVLANLPYLDKTHYLRTRTRFELVRALYRLRRERFDWLLGFHATTSLCRWAGLAGAGKMALHHHSWTYTPRGSVPVAEPGVLQNAVKRDYQVVRAMGTRVLAKQPTGLVVTPVESQWAEEQVRLAIRKCNGREDIPRFLILPGAGHPLRRYPKDLLLPVIARVRDQGRHQPVVITDEALSTEWDLRAECERLGVPLLDRGTLREFICLVSRGQRALANDSGPGHIAVALGLRTDFVFGPGCVGDWHPYDRAYHQVHRAQVSCRSEGPRDQETFQYCTVDVCRHHACMREIRDMHFF